MSGFFTQYLIFKAFIALSVDLIRGLTVFHMLVRWLFCLNDATKRERLRVVAGIRRFNNPGWLPYGKAFAQMLLVLMIVLSFAPIAPLVLIPGLCYFTYAQLSYRYTLSYVYEVTIFLCQLNLINVTVFRSSPASKSEEAFGLWFLSGSFESCACPNFLSCAFSF
jgi:hypothetical protein